MINYWNGEVDHPGERNNGRAPYPCDNPVLSHVQPEFSNHFSPGPFWQGKRRYGLPIFSKKKKKKKDGILELEETS